MKLANKVAWLFPEKKPNPSVSLYPEKVPTSINCPVSTLDWYSTVPSVKPISITAALESEMLKTKHAIPLIILLFVLIIFILSYDLVLQCYRLVKGVGMYHSKAPRFDFRFITRTAVSGIVTLLASLIPDCQRLFEVL